MMKFRVLRPGLAALALLLATSVSRADLVIGLQEAGVNGGAIVTVASTSSFDPNGVSWSGNYGDFHVTIQTGSADNGATLSDILSATTKVTNNNLINAGTNTLHLWVSETDYTLPASTILQMESSMGGSVSTGTLTLKGIYQAYADAGNALYGTGYKNGLQDAGGPPSGYSTSSQFGTFTRNGAYSLSSEVNFQLTAGGAAGYQSHVNVTPTPAPAGVVLALTGLPVLGIGGWLRRRKLA